MKAMILAAGLGTRLQPLTTDRPKALVEVGGRTMLEITLARLRASGIRDVIINVHHFAGMIVEYLNKNRNFRMHIEVSREDDLLLNTGGGLKKAAWFFEGTSEPFVLHNVDVISTIDFQRMARFHDERGALATLAVKDRQTSRPLIFDEQLELRGRGPGLAFCGIHLISPRLLENLLEEGAFSIIDTYLRLAASGERIIAFRADDYYWRDLGTPANVMEAERDLEQGRWG